MSIPWLDLTILRAELVLADPNLWYENETDPAQRSHALLAHGSSHRKRVIEEIHGKPVKAGESFSAAHIVGYFDSIEQMHEVYDRYRGHTALSADESGWRLEN